MDEDDGGGVFCCGRDGEVFEGSGSSSHDSSDACRGEERSY